MASGRTAGLRGSAPLLLPTAAIGLTFGPVGGPGLRAGPGAGDVGAGLVRRSAVRGVECDLRGRKLSGWRRSPACWPNARYLPMGFGIAPSLRGSKARNVGHRCAAGRRVVSPSPIATRATSTSRRWSGRRPCSTSAGWAARRWASPGLRSRRIRRDSGWTCSFRSSISACCCRNSADRQRAVATAAVSARDHPRRSPRSRRHGVPALAASGAALIGLLRARQRNHGGSMTWVLDRHPRPRHGRAEDRRPARSPEAAEPPAPSDPGDRLAHPGAVDLAGDQQRLRRRSALTLDARVVGLVLGAIAARAASPVDRRSGGRRGRLRRGPGLRLSRPGRDEQRSVLVANDSLRR